MESENRETKSRSVRQGEWAFEYWCGSIQEGIFDQYSLMAVTVFCLQTRFGFHLRQKLNGFLPVSSAGTNVHARTEGDQVREQCILSNPMTWRPRGSAEDPGARDA